MPKKCLNVFNRCLAVVPSFLGGAPGESDYTDGVKLKMLIPGLLLGSDSSSRLFAIVVYERCQDFLDGHWEKLHGQIQYRKPPVLKALTPMNEEGRMWQMVERERQVGDVGKMAKVLKRSFDPPPPALRVDPLVKYNDLPPRHGEPTNRESPLQASAAFADGSARCGDHHATKSSRCVPEGRARDKEQMQGCRSFGRVIPGVVLVSGARRRVGREVCWP